MADADQKAAGAAQDPEPSVHMSSETEKKVAAFENKLYQQALEEARKQMPDTSIHGISNASEIDSVSAYYPKHDVPIYDAGTNKQIDRIDMELDKVKRANRNDSIDSDAVLYMKQLRSRVASEVGKTDEEIEAANEAERLARHKRDSRFIYIVPIVIVVIAIVFCILVYFFGS
ncbi:MAG: hypothetical protein ACOX1O_07060 [Eggerthellaceae bacterium]